MPKLVVVLVALAGAGAAATQWAMSRGEVVFPDKTVVSVEVADTEALRQRGLMFRESLAPNEGMIFVFPEAGHYPFWMKNTRIPLDMLWLDRSGRVVAIASSVPPCKADPCPTFPPPDPTGPASYVLEVVSGFAAKHGVKQGDRLVLRGVGGSVP
jgi:hypothetical protein